MPSDAARALALALLCFCCHLSFAAPGAEATGRTPSSPPSSQLPVSHSVWNMLLRDYVKPSPDGINRVDYDQFKSGGRTRLKAYIASLEQASPSRLPRAERMAYWINLYNAKTADIVLDRYPVSSIKEINLPDPAGKMAEGPWKANVVTIEGRALSLDDIENKILRPGFKDARVHYALNCLSLGCPNLLPEAYEGQRLDRQLDRAASQFVNHPRGLTIKPGRVEASSIYEWFESDFGGFKGVLAHLSRFARPDLRRQLAGVKKIDAYDYDWRLNDAAAR